MSDTAPASCLPAPRAMIAAMLLAVAAALGGCAGGGAPGSNSYAMASTGSGSTVTFESIDGPPPAVFDKLVRDLNAEAQTRQLAVMSRDANAAYRVRGYVSAHSTGGRAAVTWLWDVYDRDQQRVLRLNGEQKLAGKHKDAWAALSDTALQAIARDSMEQLAGFLTSNDATPSAMQPAAYADQSSPEAAGIVRMSDPDPAADAGKPAAASEPGDNVPTPRKRVKSSVSAARGVTVAAAPRQSD